MYPSSFSIEVLDLDPIHDLYFMSALLLREPRRPIRNGPRLPPLFHCRSLGVGEATFDTDALQDRALGERSQAHAVVRHGEIEYTETRVPALVLWRLHDTVNSRLIVTTRKELHGVPRVYDLTTGHAIH